MMKNRTYWRYLRDNYPVIIAILVMLGMLTTALIEGVIVMIVFMIFCLCVTVVASILNWMHRG